MGCDIHAHTEVKIHGEWHHLNTLKISRDYDLFARMANVRNDGDVEPISEPRGYPEDCTTVTDFDMELWGEDCHSHSWLSAKEVADLIDWYDALRKQRQPDKYISSWEYEVIGYIFSAGWDYFEKYSEELPKGVEDARMVFWFDN